MYSIPGPINTQQRSISTTLTSEHKASTGAISNRSLHILKSATESKPSRLALSGRGILPFVLLGGGFALAIHVQKYVQSDKGDSDKKVRANMAGFTLAGAPAAAIPHPLDASKIRNQAASKGSAPMSTTPRNAFQGIIMASGAQVVRLGLTSSFKGGSAKSIHASEHIPPEWKSVASKASIFAGAGLAELIVHVPTAVKNGQILDPDNKGILKVAQSRSAASYFSRGTGAALTRKAVSQGILFAFKEDMDTAINAAMPSLSKTQTTSLSSFILGSLGETVTNWVDRVRILRQQDIGITKLDAIKEALREPFKGALKASIKKGISRSIYMTGLEVIVKHWDKIEDSVEIFLNTPGIADKLDSFIKHFPDNAAATESGTVIFDTRPIKPSPIALSPNSKSTSEPRPASPVAKKQD